MKRILVPLTWLQRKHETELATFLRWRNAPASPTRRVKFKIQEQAKEKPEWQTSN